jgi:hypothetical protein
MAVILALAAIGCGREHQHGGEDPRPGESITHFGEQTELFVEFRALVVGDESPFAAHVTRLVDFLPLSAGRVTVVLRRRRARRALLPMPDDARNLRPVAVHAGRQAD